MSGTDGAVGVPDAAGVQAALLVLRTESIDQVWPGYPGPGEFVLCTKDGGALLASNEPPARTPARKLEVETGSNAELYYFAERPPGLSRCIRPFGFDVEGRSMLAFPQVDSVYRLRDPRLAPAAVLIHEGFHLYQFQHFSATTGEDGFAPLEEPPSVPAEVVSSADFQELAAEEREILARALRTATTPQIRAYLRQYLAVRRRRMALVPELLRSGEAQNERKEGSAHYVASVWVSAESGGSLPEVTEMIALDLEAVPDFRDQPAAYRHWHVYFTGAAIGLLLDRLGVQWQPQVQAGATFQDVLQDVVGRSEYDRSLGYPIRISLSSVSARDR